jgi:hypothetical protein
MPRAKEIDGFSQFGLQKLHAWGCVRVVKIVLPTHRRIALAVEDVFFRFRAEDQTWYRSNGSLVLAR